MVDLLEAGRLYPPLDLGADARAVYDAVSASDVCDPAGSSQKLHLISVRDRLFQGIVRRLYWLGTRDTVAGGLTKGAVDRYLLHNISNYCRHEATRGGLVHINASLVGSATKAGENRQ